MVMGKGVPQHKLSALIVADKQCFYICPNIKIERSKIRNIPTNPTSGHVLLKANCTFTPSDVILQFNVGFVPIDWIFLVQFNFKTLDTFFDDPVFLIRVVGF